MIVIAIKTVWILSGKFYHAVAVIDVLLAVDVVVARVVVTATTTKLYKYR